VTAVLGFLLASSLHTAGLTIGLGLAAGPAATLAAIPMPQAPAEAKTSLRRSRDIRVVRSERWIDTVRGAVKNVASRAAQEVVLDVRLRNARGTVLGTETVRVGPLGPGEEKEFQLSLPEKVRSATRWEITPRASFGARARKR